MDIDLGIFTDLNRERWDLSSAPCLFIVDGKPQALVKGNEPFGVRGGDSDVINTHGRHIRPPSRGYGVYLPQCAMRIRPSMFGLAEQGRVSLTGCHAPRRAGRCAQAVHYRCARDERVPAAILA